jgi:3-phosphoglycerate kinase
VHEALQRDGRNGVAPDALEVGERVVVEQVVERRAVVAVTDDEAFVEELIRGFDAYVNDAFGASHREHASVVGPPKYLPSAAGRLLEREVATLGG